MRDGLNEVENTAVKIIKGIMVVDDDSVIRDIVRSCLLAVNPKIRIQGYGSAADALEDLSFFSPDIILLDLMMPVMDGYEALPLFRGGINGATKIIITTAAELSQTKKETLLKSGVDGFLNKPFNPKTLLTELEPYFEGESETQPVLLSVTGDSDLQSAFAARLRKIDALTSSYLLKISGSHVVRAQDTAALREGLHTLAGSAGLFSMAQVGHAASDAEAALVAFAAQTGSQENRQGVVHALEALRSVIASAGSERRC